MEGYSATHMHRSYQPLVYNFANRDALVANLIIQEI